MPSIAGKIITRAAMSALAVAAVAVAGDAAGPAAAHHAPLANRVAAVTVALADNNNPGPDFAPGTPAA